MNLNNIIRRFGLNSIILTCVAGALYFTYRKGRVDEIDELCDIVTEHGGVKLTFKPYDKVTTIFMEQL